MVFWLLPDLVGGLPNLDNALVPHPAFRISMSVFMLYWTVKAIIWDSISRMSTPSRLFEERLRSEISPHASKLALAAQLFDGRQEDLWKFIHAQGMWLSIFGIAVDSRLPGKVAPLLVSVLGAIAWGLARR